MKGDFTRLIFKKENHFHDVRMQQGRVQLDADWNEQLDITAHRVETETVDVLGRSGASKDHGGFHIVPKVDDLTAEEKERRPNQNPPPLDQKGDVYISGGRFYVNGLLCENEHIVAYTKQPDLPDTKHVEKEGRYLAYLDVWQRHITALDIPLIREVALGGPDTATRTKTIWQVKLFWLGEAGTNVNCLSTLERWDGEVAPGSGQLAAQTNPGTQSADPCTLSPDAGYRRLENQLYRVEVHTEGARGTASFKWSRDNGSIVTTWEGQDVNALRIGGIGRNQVLNFASDQWIELTDDTHELLGKPGTLVKVAKVEGDVLTIDPSTANGPIDRTSFPLNPKVRRWDLKKGGELKPTNANWINLEDGVQVRFSAGTYKSGDYWLIPARTAAGQDSAGVEWPVDTARDPKLQPPHGIKHHYSRLALLDFDGTKWTPVSDCRHVFSPITELTSLYYAGGDGQEAMPGHKLPQALRVRVANGQAPVINAKVRFSVLAEAGTQGGTLSTSASVLTTAPDGIAECDWTLGRSGTQRVEAALLDDAGQPIPGQVIRFSANLSIAEEVWYDSQKCNYLRDRRASTVQAAIDELCQRKCRGACAVSVGKGGQYETLSEALWSLLKDQRRDIWICLLPGDHELSGAQQAPEISGFENTHIEITGCGQGSRLHLKEPLTVPNVASICLRDLAINADRFQNAAISFKTCARVILESCFLSGITSENYLLQIGGANHVRLYNNTIESAAAKSFNAPAKVFNKVSVKGLTDLFNAAFFLGDFSREAVKVIDKLSLLDTRKRRAISKEIEDSVKSDVKLSTDEKERYSVFAGTLAARTASKELLLSTINNIRGEIVLKLPGNAVAIMDSDADVVLENNDIIGIASFYGVYLKAELSADGLKSLGALLRRSAVGLVGSTGRLRFLNNRLTRMLVADTLIERIKRTIDEGKGKIDGIFRDSFIEANVFGAGQSQIVGQRIFMNSNSFGTLRGIAGTAIADSIVYVGNQGAGADTRFSNISRIDKGAANLLINILPTPSS